MEEEEKSEFISTNGWSNMIKQIRIGNEVSKSTKVNELMI